MHSHTHTKRSTLMPTLDAHQSNIYTKLLIMGDSGSGKTGALTSLVSEGYKLRIIDFDNGLESLKQFVLKECPDNIGNIEYVTLRDKRRVGAEGFEVAKPEAFVKAIKLLDKWKYDDVDLGPPAEWGSDTILVIDSLTFMSDAAFDWRETLTPRGRDGKYDMRAVYGDAQGAVEGVLAGVTSENFQTNVIVISHIRYIENEDGTTKGYATAVGKALGPVIPRYFNSVALCKTQAGGKRTIQTAATAMIDLKNPKPFAMAPSYPIETGLAEFFKVLRDPPEKKVTKLTLKRA